MVVLLIASIAATDLIADRYEPPHSGLFLKLVIVTGYMVWALRYVGLSTEELGLGRSSMRAGVRDGLIAALCIAGVIAILVAIPASRSYFSSSHAVSGSTTSRFLQPLVVIPLGTVVFEEVIFRGVLLAVLLRWGSRRQAIVVSSVVFGFWHVIPALGHVSGKGVVASLGVVVGTIAATSVAGALFAWLRIRSNSLFAPILAHVATNSFAYVGALIVVT